MAVIIQEPFSMVISSFALNVTTQQLFLENLFLNTRKNGIYCNEIKQPKIYNSIEEAVSDLKLDRRRKYQEWNGDLIYTAKYTTPCSGCSCDCSDGFGCNHGNSGCSECGYTGKRKDYYPIPVFMPDGSTIVKVNSK